MNDTLMGEYVHKDIEKMLKDYKNGKRNVSIPIWRRYTLTVEEASEYFRIGTTKLRKLINENKDAEYLIWNGTRPQIKRAQFEKYIDHCSLI